MKKSPFKFLDSYSKEDRNVFFGRDNEIEELHSRVFQSRILVVYGISGTGKSSLINCGLANKFNDSDWLPVNIRRGSNINLSLYESLKRNMLSNIPGENSKSIFKLLRSVYLDHFKPIFLILDQFEEVFIFGSRAEREEFIQTVKKIIDSDIQCRLIFSMREEYLAGFTEFEKIIPDFLDNRIRIEKMTRQNAAKAIEGPCEVNRIATDEGLSKIILEKLNPDNPEVELTYLQVYLDKLFRIASEENEDVIRLSLAHTEKIGDVKDLLGAFLEEQISRLDDPDAGLVILKSFVSVHGTKHQITEDEVIEYTRTLGKELGNEKVKDLIQKFIKLRILRDKDEHGRYELRHDSLASCIYEKITLVEKELLEIRQFIENSWNNFERRNLYLNSDDLEYIAPYEDKLFLNEKLTKFISQSKRIIHKAKRRRQNAMIISAAVLIAILSFFTIWAMREKRNAVVQQDIAEQQKNSAVRAMMVADSARKEAVRSKDLAVKNEQIALVAQSQSEQSRKEALLQKELAIQQKSLAEKLTIESTEQARIATEQRNVAEHERQKAVEAEAASTRMSNLSKAQNLALSSLSNVSLENTPKIGCTLAYLSYKYNLDNGGPDYDPVIYEALNKAWIVADSARHSVFTGTGSEIWSIADDSLFIATADLDGKFCRWTSDGKVSGSEQLNTGSPVRFVQIDRVSQNILTQCDNGEISLWKLTKMGTGRFEPFKIPSGGIIRSADFCDRGRYLVTGANDSIIKIWNVSDSPVLLKTFRVSSEVLSVLFCSPDTVFYACSDGSVNIMKNGKTENLASFNDKPLSMGMAGRKLVVGYQSGSMGVFSRKDPVRFEYRVEQNKSGIDKMAFSNDYKLLAMASRDRTISLFYVDEYFSRNNTYGGVVHFKNLPGRVRSLVFTKDDKLVAGLSDKSIRIWETSYMKLADMIREKIPGIISDTTLTQKR